MKGQSKWYEKDGKKYDRVTTILDYFTLPELLEWKLSVGKKEAKRIGTVAMKIGTKVDEWCKGYLLGENPKRSKELEVNNCVEAFLEWREGYAEELKVGETVYCEELLLAGTPDLIMGDTIIDLKCSSEIRPNYWLQTAMYAYMSGAKNIAILSLDKNLSIYDYKVKSDFHREVEVFCGLMKAYRYYQVQE